MSNDKTVAEPTANSLAAGVERLTPYQFKPGQSGNPNGRPKKVQALNDKALEASKRAIEVAIALLDDPDPRIVLAAAQLVLDRGLGKPRPAVEYPEDRRKIEELSDAELMEMLRDGNRRRMEISQGDDAEDEGETSTH